jgi:ATP-dependent Clp protease ATP-binding subunit ClpA
MIDEMSPVTFPIRQIKKDFLSNISTSPIYLLHFFFLPEEKYRCVLEAFFLLLCPKYSSSDFDKTLAHVRAIAKKHVRRLPSKTCNKNTRLAFVTEVFLNRLAFHVANEEQQRDYALVGEVLYYFLDHLSYHRSHFDFYKELLESWKTDYSRVAAAVILLKIALLSVLSEQRSAFFAKHLGTEMYPNVAPFLLDYVEENLNNVENSSDEITFEEDSDEDFDEDSDEDSEEIFEEEFIEKNQPPPSLELNLTTTIQLLSKIIEENGFLCSAQQALSWMGHPATLPEDIFQMKEPSKMNKTGIPKRITSKLALNYLIPAEDILENPKYQGCFCLGRENERSQILSLIQRRVRRHVVVVGDSGIGKSTLLTSVFCDLSEIPRCEDGGLRTGFGLLKPSSLLAGSPPEIELNNRVKTLIDAVSSEYEKYVFFLDFSSFVNNTERLVLKFLKSFSALADEAGNVSLVATLSSQDVSALEGVSFYETYYNQINLKPVSGDTLEKIYDHNLKDVCQHYCIDSNLSFENARRLLLRVSRGGTSLRRFVDAIDGAANVARSAGSSVLDLCHLAEYVAGILNVPVAVLQNSEDENLAELEKRLYAEVFDQEEAIKSVVDGLYFARAGLVSGGRPQAIMLFQGPTGSGKTLIAQKTAECLGMKLLRYDMSCFSQPHTVSTFIGSPPGYVGYRDGGAGDGLLIKDVSENPYSVILLDEVEKAHPDVLKVFLQIFDYGKLKSNSGKEVDFSNTIIMMTSNLGADLANRSALGFVASSTPEERYQGRSIEFFSPEFMGRIDRVVIFKPLTEAGHLRVVEGLVAPIIAAAAAAGFSVEPPIEEMKAIAKISSQDPFGARKARTLVRDRIAARVARQIVEAKTAKARRV